jgi:CRP-like cAMP-binding protein
MNLAQVLRRCEVFVGLDDSDLEKIAGLPSWRRTTYGAGESVFCENDVAKDFYILEEGEVRLVVASGKGRGTKEPVRVSVDTITKGDVFGWSSLVAPHSRNMSAICARPSTILSITGTELSRLMDHNDSLGYEVMKSLVRVIGKRLRDLQNKFAGE